MLVSDWLNRISWPAAQTLKRYGEKTAFQNSQTASANIFHQNKKVIQKRPFHPKDE
jgi:hypothetical protein